MIENDAVDDRTAVLRQFGSSKRRYRERKASVVALSDRGRGLDVTIKNTREPTCVDVVFLTLLKIQQEPQSQRRS